MNKPTPEDQLRFLTDVQRLLSEGQFVATYKFALLLALADICIEHGDDTGAPFMIGTDLIAQKFIAYYWRQARPYMAAADAKSLGGKILRQNTGTTAGVIRLLQRHHAKGFGSVAQLKRYGAGWKRLVMEIDKIVRTMPLWKLQTVGQTKFEFLYENKGRGSSILLRPGVMFCFRKFHPLISDLGRGAWVRYVRRFNADVLGIPTDLDEFLFGSERASLAVYAPILREVQESKCFYCQKELRQQEDPHVDHFIPWARYPMDFGHNFVLTHQSCNAAKSEHLAAAEHLCRWMIRNHEADSFLRDQFEARGVVHDLALSKRITFWAYSTACNTAALTWIRKCEFEPLNEQWVRCFSWRRSSLRQAEPTDNL